MKCDANGNGLTGFRQTRFGEDHIRSQFMAAPDAKDQMRSQFLAASDAKEAFGIQDHFKPLSYFEPRFYNPIIYKNESSIQKNSGNDIKVSTSRSGICESGHANDFQIPSRPANVMRSAYDFPVRPESTIKSSNGQVSSASVHVLTTSLPSLVKPSGVKDDTIPIAPLSSAAQKQNNDQPGFSLLGPQGPASPVDPTEDAEVMDPRNLLSSAPLIEDFPVPEEYRVSKYICQ